MTNANTPTKRELLDLLREQAEAVESIVSRLTDEQLTQGRYESGWNGKQILAHVASIEWTYPRLIDLAKGPGVSTPPRTDAEKSARPATPAASSTAVPPAATSANPVDSYNARQVEKRADASVAALLEEFRANRAALIEAVETADEALFAVPITSAGGAKGPLGAVIKFVALDHVGVHVRDLAGEAS
jgi:hypothetical protein